MTPWIAISVLAAFLQNLRSSVQKRLTRELSTQGATATRFLYGLPFAALWLGIVTLGIGVVSVDAGGANVGGTSAGTAFAALPTPNLRFVLFACAGSVAQIAATALLIATFSSRSFAAGTAYSKTEGMQTVLFGYLVLGDRVSMGGLAGVVLTVLGVLAVSLSRLGASAEPGAAASGVAGDADTGRASGVRRASRARWRVAGLGLLSGALFAVSAVGYRGASLALGDAHFLLRASCTLVFALVVQSVLTATRLALVEPGQLAKVLRLWRWGLVAGATGAGASACWFTAFTLTNAAYVKAVGSVELVFAVASSWLLFRERPSPAELAGIALVLLGVVVTATLR